VAPIYRRASADATPTAEGSGTQYWLRRLRDGDITVHASAQEPGARFAAGLGQAETFVFHLADQPPAPAPVLGPTLTSAPIPSVPQFAPPTEGSAIDASLGGPAS
jgi:hypothetical protein